MKKWAAVGLLAGIGVLGMVVQPAAQAKQGGPINAADTAWILTATALVLLMTPGLSFFYGGMVRLKNVVSTLLQSFMAMAVISLLWVVVGCLLGTAVGVMPGLGSSMAVALLLPVTFALEPTAAFIMFSGVYFGGLFGDSTMAILMNTPGQASAIASTFEGHRMAQDGRAAQALATAALGGEVMPGVGTATFYHADYVLPWWAGSLTRLGAVGRHVFYRWPGAVERALSRGVRYAGVEPGTPASEAGGAVVRGTAGFGVTVHRGVAADVSAEIGSAPVATRPAVLHGVRIHRGEPPPTQADSVSPAA